MPTIPPNSLSGLYDVDANAVPIGANVYANNGTFTGNVTIDGFLLVDGSITTNSNFVGNLVGNVTGNITLATANTQVVYNDDGVTGGSAALTFDEATNTLSVGGNVTSTGNVSAVYFLGDGSQLTGIPTSYSNANVVTLLAAFGSNTISTTGNITAGYFLGNGSQLTGLPQQYGNANVAAYLASGSDTLDIITQGTVQGNRLQTSGGPGNIVGANYISANYFVGDGSLLSNINAGNITGAYGNANVATFLANFGSNSISTTGNITANYFLGNGSLLTGVTSSLSGNLAGNLEGNGFGLANAAFVTATGNVTAGNVITSAQVQAATAVITGNVIAGNILTDQGDFSGNVTANYFIGDGSQLTNLPLGNYSNANVANYLPTFSGNVGAGNVIFTSTTGRLYVNEIQGLSGAGLSIASDGTEDINLNADTVRIGDNNADATLATHGTGDLILRTNLGDASQGNIRIYDGASGNIDITTNGSGVVNIAGTGGLHVTDGITATGNVTGGNLITAGVVTATGNVTGGNVTTAGVVTATGNVTGGNVTTAGVVTATGNVTGGNLTTVGAVDATGNITGGNVTATSTVTGTLANLGNIRINAANIFNTNSSNISAASNPARIILGNITTTGLDSIGNAAVVTGGTGTLGNTAAVFTGTTISNFTTLSANVSNNSTRLAGLQTFMVLNGNTSNFGYEPTTGPRAFTVFNNQLRVGTSDLVGVAGQNGTRVTSAAMAFNQLRISPTSNVATGFGGISEFTLYRASPSSKGGTTFAAAANIGNVIGQSISMPAAIGANGQPNSPSLVTTLYHPSNVSTYGVSIDNQFRQATEYHFLRCDDNAAINWMGSIARMHSRMANSSTTTGTININKNNGQAQRIEPTGNVTIGDLQNFVTTSTNGSTTFSEEDNVRVYIVQGATAYTVTMPTGNTSIRYLGNTSTVSNVANTTSCLNITAINTAAGAQYLINIQTYGA